MISVLNACYCLKSKLLGDIAVLLTYALAWVYFTLLNVLFGFSKSHVNWFWRRKKRSFTNINLAPLQNTGSVFPNHDLGNAISFTLYDCLLWELRMIKGFFLFCSEKFHTEKTQWSFKTTVGLMNFQCVHNPSNPYEIWCNGKNIKCKMNQKRHH